MKKIFTCLLIAICFIFSSTIFAENTKLQTSPELLEIINRQGQLGIVEISSMEFSSNYKGNQPPEAILDGDVDSFYALKEDAQSAWVNLNFEEPVYLYEIQIDAYIPADAEFLLQTEIDNELVTLPASYILGESFGSIMDLSKDALLIDNLILRIHGNSLSAFRLNEIHFYAKYENFILHKKTLIPETFFSNNAQLNTDFILVDGKIGTQWKNLNQGTNSVLRWLNQQRDTITSAEPRSHNKLGDEIYFRLHQPGPMEFLKFYSTEDSKGEMTVSVFSDDTWVELETYNLENMNGWEEIDLSHLGIIEHVVIALSDPSQPWNIGSYGGIGEIEIWAKEVPETVQMLDLVSSTTSLGNSAIFNLNTPEELDYSIQVVLAGEEADMPDPELNGHKLMNGSVTPYGGFVIWKFLFPSNYLNAESNIFFPGTGSTLELLSAHLVSKVHGKLNFNTSTELNDGKKYTGNPWSDDPQFLGLLEGEADMEEILLYFRNHAPDFIYLGNDGLWESRDMDPVSEREQKTEDSGFLDSIRIDQPGDLQEVEIFGSPNEIITPYIEILFPVDDMVLPQYVTHNYKVVGITDSPEGTVTINGLPVHMEDNFFWIEMRDLQITEPGTHLIESSIVLDNGQNSLDSVSLSIESDSHHLFIDQEDKLYTQSDRSFVLTGKISGNASDLFINNHEISLSRNNRFVSEIPLNSGLNLIQIELRDPVTQHVLIKETRRVILLWGESMLQITSPEDGSLCQSDSIEVKGIVSPWGLETVLVNGNAAEIEGNLFHCELNNLVDIHNLITVVAEYEDGLRIEKEIWVSKDTDAPMLSHILPENGTMVSAFEVVVTGVVEDSNDVSVFVNGKTANINGNHFSCITSLPLEGNNPIRITARDFAGRESSIPVFNVFRDTTPPEPFDVHVQPSTYTNDRRPQIEFSSSDTASGLSHFEVSVNHYGFSQQASPFLLPYLNEGENLIIVRAYDVLGNYRDSSVNITIDTQAPDNVQNFRAVPGLDIMYLRWDEDDEETAYYVIDSSQLTNEVIVERGDGLEQGDGFLSFEYVIDGLEVGQEYSFSIYAVDMAENIGAINRCSAITGYNDIALEHDDLNVLEYENLDLYFPEGIASEGIESIIIREVEDEYVEEQSLNPILSPIYSFSVNTVEGELEHVLFEKPFVGEFSYEDLIIPENLDEKQLAVFYFDEDWGRWFRTEGNIVDTETKTIAFSSDHFSMYSVQPTISEFGNIGGFMDIGGYSRSSTTQHAPITVSPQNGTAKTSMTEFVLPGIAGLDLAIRRTYDTMTADMDSSWARINLQAALPPNQIGPQSGDPCQKAQEYFAEKNKTTLNQEDSKSRSIYANTANNKDDEDTDPNQEAINNFLNNPWDKIDNYYESLERNRMLTRADHSFALGQGWRLDLPYLKYTDSGVLIRTPDGGFINSQILDRRQKRDTGTLDLFDTLSGGYSVRLRRDKVGYSYPHYRIKDVTLTTFDGIEYIFNDVGLLQSISHSHDVEKNNVITFYYNEFQLAYINDSHGRQVVFEHGENGQITDIYVFNEVKLLSNTGILSDQDKLVGNYYYHVKYEYNDVNLLVEDFPLLERATDVQNRIWDYDYNIFHLDTQYSAGESFYPNHIKSHFIFPLSTAKGPGIGYSTLNYYETFTSIDYEHEDNVIAMQEVRINASDPDKSNTRMEVLNVDSVSIFENENDEAAKKVTDFDYNIEVVYDKMDFRRNYETIVSDGRLKQIFNYNEQDFEVHNPSTIPNFTIIGRRHNVFPQSVLSRVRKYTYDGSREILEEDKRYFYSKHQILPIRTELKWGAVLDAYSIINSYVYDRWRNITQIHHVENTGSSTKSRITYNWYENENSVVDIRSQYSLQYDNPMGTDTPLRDFKSLGIYNRLHHSITLYADSAEMSDVSLGNCVYYRYDVNGRLAETKDLRTYDGNTPDAKDWSTDSFTYNSRGELRSHTNSMNGVTDYLRDYTQSPYSVNVSKTVDVLDGDAEGTLVTTTYKVDSVSGNVLSSMVPGDIETIYSYDKLGRITSIKKPSILHQDNSTGYKLTENSESYILMEYGDSLNNLYTVRVDSEDQVQLLKYNNHGEMVSINEFKNQDFSLDSINIYSSIKNIPSDRITSIKPDYYGNISKITYPNTQVTTFSYDGLGRLLSKNYAEEGNARSISYRYSPRNRTTERTNEQGNRVVQYRDAAGNITKINELDRGGYLLRKQQFAYNALGEMVSSEDGEGNIRTYSYNLWGQLSQVQLPAADYFIDNLNTFEDKKLTIERNYNELGLLSSQEIKIDDSSFSESSYKYDDFGLLTIQKQNYTEKNHDNYSVYDNENFDLLLSEDNTYISETNFKYNELRQLVRIIDPENQNWDRSYNRRGQIQTITTPAPDNATIRYNYDTMDRVTQITDARQNASYINYNGITNYEYDSFGRLDKVRMPYRGNNATLRPEYSIIYDIMDNVSRIENPDNTYMAFTYTDHNQYLETKTYGTNNNEVSKTYTSTYRYDEVGNLVSVLLPGDGENEKQEFSYDPLGRRISASFPGGIENFFGYDANNNLTWVQDGRGYRQSIEYDSLNRAEKVTDANDQEWNYAYHPLGGVSKTTDPMNASHLYKYDERGLIYEERNGRGKIDYYSYNAMGQLAVHQDPRGTQSHFQYNTSGMLEEVNFINGTESHTVSYDYDEMGALKSATDGSVTSTYNYIDNQYAPDPNGLIRNLHTSKTGGAYSSNVDYGYDIMNRLTSIQNGNISDRINYQYDTLGQLSEIFKNEKLPGTVGFTNDDNCNFFSNAVYNDKGLLSSYNLANGVSVNKIYDERRRLEHFTYNDINNEIVKKYSFTYDKADNIIQKNQNYYGYDGRNQMVTAMISDAALPAGEDPVEEFEVNNAFNDILGERIVVENIPENVELSDRKLDWGAQSIAADLGYPALISSIEINVEKAEDIDRIKGDTLVVYTSMSNYEYSYSLMEIKDYDMDLDLNNDGSFSGVIHIELATPILSRFIKIHSHYNERMFDYTSDRSRATVQVNSEKPLTVFKMLGTGRNEFYSYNDKGNRESSSFMGSDNGSYGYEYYNHSDLLKTDGKYAYIYDNNGNLVEKGDHYTITDNSVTIEQKGIYWVYHYDLLNRLSSVDKLTEDATIKEVASYTYDAHGYRILKKSGTETTKYVFDLMGNVIEEINPDGESTRFVYAGRTMISQINHDGSVYAVGTDHLGSTTFLVDESGEVIWESEMSPFGDQEDKAGFYTSKQWDEDVELYYFNARWYDPETGRFITEDPIRDGTGWYSYVGNNPMGFVDPTGLESAAGMPSGLYYDMFQDGDPHVGGGEYTVKKGDTFWDIGRELGIDYQELMEKNGYDSDSAKNLQIGTVLSLPGLDTSSGGGHNFGGNSQGTTPSGEESKTGVPPPGAGGGPPEVHQVKAEFSEMVFSTELPSVKQIGGGRATVFFIDELTGKVSLARYKVFGLRKTGLLMAGVTYDMNIGSIEASFIGGDFMSKAHFAYQGDFVSKGGSASQAIFGAGLSTVESTDGAWTNGRQTTLSAGYNLLPVHLGICIANYELIDGSQIMDAKALYESLSNPPNSWTDPFVHEYYIQQDSRFSVND